jgi:riboflavin kinase/FMN adenylyltransferase
MKLPITLKSKVIHGNKMGRKLGFPTANFDTNNLFIKNSQENETASSTQDFILLNNTKQFLDTGIYACLTFFEGKEYQSAGYIGSNETFEKNAFKLEIHILDFDADLYDKTLTTTFLEKIRGDKKFNSLEEIKLQIQKDCQQIRDYFALASKQQG